MLGGSAAGPAVRGPCPSALGSLRESGSTPVTVGLMHTCAVMGAASSRAGQCMPLFARSTPMTDAPGPHARWAGRPPCGASRGSAAGAPLAAASPLCARATRRSACANCARSRPSPLPGTAALTWFQTCSRGGRQSQHPGAAAHSADTTADTHSPHTLAPHTVMGHAWPCSDGVHAVPRQPPKASCTHPSLPGLGRWTVQETPATRSVPCSGCPQAAPCAQRRPWPQRLSAARLRPSPPPQTRRL